MDTNMSVTCHKFQHPLDYKNIQIREAPLKNVVLSNGAQGTQLFNSFYVSSRFFTKLACM